MKKSLSCLIALVMLLTFCFGNGSAETTSFRGLNDSSLQQYIGDSLYSELVGTLNSEDYYVSNVQTVYISQEYLDELEFNSQTNVYFGYSLADLDAEFQGTRYVFTLGEDGKTTVIPFESYDDTYSQVIRNVAIGTGVILICVTVSVVTAGTGAAAVSMIFAVAAKTGATCALSGAVLGGLSAGIITGIQTGNMDEAVKAAALAGSEAFKWGAITGAISGGIGEGIALKGATLNGLTMNEAALIQKQTKWPLDAIKSLHSTEEANIYIKAGLTPTRMTDGSWGFLQNIDWDRVDDFGNTNAQRVANNLAPLDSTGTPYELHHIGQKADSPLAILTKAEHHARGDFGILHYADEGKDVADAVWAQQKADFWKDVAKLAGRLIE